MGQLRQDIPQPPRAIAELPVDRRGYPVPFFVEWIKGEPEFRAMSHDRIVACVRDKLCWVCGEPLGELPPVFVIGPMCAINRISSEPPSHAVCARYSVTACPFLSRPQMTRRENDLPDSITPGAGFSIKRNPGVTLLWFASNFEIWKEERGLLWHFTRDPKGVEWWTCGRKATRVEVLASIQSGLPELEKYAALQGADAMAALDRYKIRANRLLPVAA